MWWAFRTNLVSGPVLDDETPVCAALSLLGKFRFPAAFECPIGDWFESYQPSSLLCLREGVRYDWVPGTQFESSQVHHAFTREPGFPEIRQLAPNWQANRVRKRQNITLAEEAAPCKEQMT